MKPAAALVGLLLAACSGEPRAGKLVSVRSAPDTTASTVELESLTVEEPRRLGKGHAMAWTEGTIAIADGPDMVLVDETTLVERERIAATSWTAPPQGKAVDPNDVRVPDGHVIAAALSPDGTRVAVKIDGGALVVVSLDETLDGTLGGKVVSGPAFVPITALSTGVSWAPGVLATPALGCEVHLIRTNRVALLPRSKFTQACGLGLSPDAKRLLVGRQIFVGRPGDEVELYDADNLTRLSGWDLGNDDDQPYVAWPTTGGSGGVHLWEPRATAAVPVHSIAVSPAFAGAGTLIIEQTDGLTAVSIATGAVLWRADLGAIILGLAASEDVVVATSNRGGFFRLDAQTGRVVVREPSLNGSALAFLPGGNIAHLGVDDAVRVLTPEAKELARILPVRESAGAWVIADGTFERIGDPARELICRASGKVVPFARCASLERRGLLTNLLSAGRDPR
jgi:hypothetical protein